MIDLNFGHDDRLFQEGIRDKAEELRDGALAGIGVDYPGMKQDLGDLKDKGSEYDNIINKGMVVNKDIFEPVAGTLKNWDQTLGRHRVDNRSLIARARNSTLQFPVYVSQSCPVNAANTISNAWERVYATLVQSVFSQSPFISEDEANDLGFLKKFHSNIRESAEDVWKKYSNLFNEYYQPIDEFDQMMKESIFHRVRLSDNCYVEFCVVPTDDIDLIAENARLINVPLTGFSYLQEDKIKILDKKDPILAKNDEKIDIQTTDRYNNLSGETVGQWKALSDQDLRDMAMDEIELSKEEREVLQTSYKDYAGDPADRFNYDIRSGKYHRYRQNAIDKINAKVDEIKNAIKNHDPKYKSYHYDGGRYFYNHMASSKIVKTVKGDAVDVPELLRDSDIKKINNALPYSMKVTFRVRTNGGQDVDMKYIVLIKTVMHVIRAKDLADDLQDLIMGSQKNLRKIQYKTGEITFMDYLFNVRGLKADAAKGINYNQRWLNTLKRLGEYQKLGGSILKMPTKLLNRGDIPIPNATLILTQPDVTMLTSETGIDLSKIENASRLMKRLFLFTMIIVDASDGTLRVLYDEAGDWDTQSLASIDAETSKTDNSQLARELNRMINR